MSGSNTTPALTTTIERPHNIKKHKLHNHSDIRNDSNTGPHGPNNHIHNFFDDHHHPEESEWHNKTNNEFKNNYLNSEIEHYNKVKNDIDKYVNKLFRDNKYEKIYNITNDNKYLNHLKGEIDNIEIKSNDVDLKFRLREILYKQFINKGEEKTNIVNPLNHKILPCMYYTDYNCPKDHCKKEDTDSLTENLNIKCIPKDKKKVSTCLDLYGSNNCEKHYIDNEDNTCKWTEWKSQNENTPDRYLGKCSSNGNVSKPKESCSNDEYLIKKYGKGELSETLINSICLPINDSKTTNILYDNPNYINNKHIRNNKGEKIGNNLLKTFCESKNYEYKDSESLNRWHSESNNCYNLKEFLCHKNSKKVCDIIKESFELNKQYKNKNKVCFWRQLHKSNIPKYYNIPEYSNPEYYNPEYSNSEYSNKYSEKGICENLV